MKNKKGVELAIGSIVIIILALVVLVILILGFTTGWQNLWGKALMFTGGQDNVETVLEVCQIACAKGSVYGYCNEVRTVKRDLNNNGEFDEDGKEILKKNCNDLESTLNSEGGGEVLKCNLITCDGGNQVTPSAEEVAVSDPQGAEIDTAS